MQCNETNPLLEISFHVNKYYLEELYHSSTLLECSLHDKDFLSPVGFVICRQVPKQDQPEFRTLKRKTEELKNGPKCSKKLSVSSQFFSQSVPRKDVHTALKDLNLMPQIGTGLLFTLPISRFSELDLFSVGELCKSARLLK